MRTNSRIQQRMGICPRGHDDKQQPLVNKVCVSCNEADKRLKAAAKASTAREPIRPYVDKDQTKTQAARARKHASPFSAKEAKRVAVYNAYAPVWKKEHPECEAKLIGCTGETTDVHHKKGRGPYLLDTATWLPVCRPCHSQIEMMSKDEAVSRGLSLYRIRNNDEAA